MALKWNAPVFVSNTFAVTFEYKKDIRRHANQIEDSLKNYASILGGGYDVPIVIPIPDEVEPNAPRLVFNSLHGFSQMIFNQTGVTLNAAYSEDYTAIGAAELRKKYLRERIKILQDILTEVECNVLFSGLVSRVLILTAEDENTLQKFLPTLIPEKYKDKADSLYESIFRKTEILEGKYFNIFQVSSYREIPSGQNPFVVPRASAHKSLKRGIEIVHDINDRYSYNENSGYFTNSTEIERMFGLSEDIVQQFLTRAERG